MTEVVKEEIKTDEGKADDIKETKSVYIPEMCAWVDDEGTGYDIEVILPGVEKDRVKLKILDDGFFVEGETDLIRYSGTYFMDCPIDDKSVKATYNNGLLKIHLSFKDTIRDALDVKID